MDANSLDQVLSSADGRWSVPEGWQQGRGAFGGIVVGAMMRAVTGAEGDPSRRIRSVTAELVGPVPAEQVELRVELLRRGNAVSSWRAWIAHAGEVLAHAVVVCGADRPAAPSWAVPSPPLPAVPPVVDLPRSVAPVFSQHFAYRPTGALPFTGSAVAETAGYVRARSAARVRDDAFVAAHADAYWLAAMPTFDGPRPAATVAFTLHLLHSLAEVKDAEGPLFHTATSPHCRAGYASETRELYAASGELLAINHQLIAIIK